MCARSLEHGINDAHWSFTPLRFAAYRHSVWEPATVGGELAAERYAATTSVADENPTRRASISRCAWSCSRGTESTTRRACLHSA